MWITKTQSEHYFNSKKNISFYNLIKKCKIQIFSTNNFKFNHENISYLDFAKEYSSNGWIKRKIIALPMALWSIFIKTIYYLVKAIVNSEKQNYYKAYMNLKVGFGYFITIFSDFHGSYHIQPSSFHKKCYNISNKEKIESLNELEKINSQISGDGCKGKIIFVDITSEGGEEAINSIRQINQEKEKSIHEISNSKTAHFGLSCCFNLSIAIANKSNKIVMLDYDPTVVKFNKIVREQLIFSSNSLEFSKNLVSACKQDKEISKRKFFPQTKNTRAEVDDLSFILNRDDSFLSNEEGFEFIKKIAESGDFHIFQGSIYDEKMIENIVNAAKAEGVQFQSLFISNVYDWDSDNKKQNLLLKNMERLSNDTTLIVDVVPSYGNHWIVNVAHYIDSQSKQPYNPQKIRETPKIRSCPAPPSVDLLSQ